MATYYFTYLVLPALSAIIAGILALYAWHRYAGPGTTPFIVIMTALFIWSLGYIMEIVNTSLPEKLFWGNVQYLGVVTVPVMWFVFALQYTGLAKWLTKRNFILLLILPLITLILTWSNNLHGLMWQNVQLVDAGPLFMVLREHGIWFWVNLSYSYILLVIAMTIVIWRLFRLHRLYRDQAIAVLIAMLAPCIGNALTLLHLNPIPHLDLTPCTFTISGMAVAWGLLHLHLLDIIPVAHDTVIKSMNDAMIVLDAGNRIVDLNPSAQRIIRHTNPADADIIGLPVDYILPGWLELMEKQYRADSVNSEIILGEGEEQRCYMLHVSSLYERHELISGRLVLLYDITERKKADRALKESEERYRTTVEHMGTATLIFEEDMTISLANRQAELLTGYSKEEIEGNMRWSDLVVPEDREKIETCHRDRKSLESPAEYESRLLDKQGSIKTVACTVSLIPETNKCIASLLDITERKRTEEELAKYRESLEEAHARLKQQSSLIAQTEKMSAVGTLAAGVAHELYNPMMGMLNFVQYCLKHTDENDSRHPVLQDIEHETKRCIETVDNLLTFSHGQNLKAEEYKKGNFTKIIDRILRLLDYRIKNEGVRVTRNIAAGTPDVWMQIKRFQEVLLNLMTNALDAVADSERREIRIEVQHTNEFILVAMTDTGPGITAGDTEEIFNPFFTTKTTGKSTGLGLSLCRSIITEHQGRITCQSEPGIATTFTISLPIEKRGKVRQDEQTYPDN